jgi:hypothetical protein
MRKISFLSLLVLIFIFSSCFSLKEYPVEYDYSFGGDFQNYSTYSFINNSGESPLEKKVVEETIQHYMEVLGYSYQEEAPTFYINYLYLPDSLSYKGYEQPEFFKFVKFGKDEDKDKEKYQAKKLKIKSGTLIISFIEQKNYATIWQGYTTDLYKEDIQTDPRKTRLAVLSILKNYVYLPDIN